MNRKITAETAFFQTGLTELKAEILLRRFFSKRIYLPMMLFWLFLLTAGLSAQTSDVPANDNSSSVKNEPPIVTASVSDTSKNNSPNFSAQIDAAKPLTLAEAIDLSLKQASQYKSAQIGEQIASEDVKQAKAAFYPKVAAAPTVIYTTPSLGTVTTTDSTTVSATTTTTRPPSFLGANAISEFQALINTSGEIDTSGRLKATLKKNKALLESARLGSEIARRDLINAVQDAYLNLALATLKRRGAEMSLRSAQEFENYTKLQLDAGEVAPVDLVRARLQSSTRTDELEQAKTNEAVSADSLRVFIGHDFSSPIATEDLLVEIPRAGEIENYEQTAIQTRPEFAQFEADRLAAEQDVKIARSERRPQITYSIGSGFVSDSLKPRPIYNSLGVQATIGVTIPIFDKGMRSREAQAKLKVQQAENNRQLAERQFAQEFFTARTQAFSARSRIRQLAGGLRDAEANVSASRSRYGAGEAPITEVTDAENLLVTRRQSLYQAIFDYQSARAGLLRSIGK